MPTDPVEVEVIRRAIFDRLKIERNRHLSLGFNAEHDKKMTPAKWVAVICRSAGMAVDEGGECEDKERFERQMVRVGSIVLAVLELMAGAEFEGTVAGPTEEQRGKQI